MEVIKVSKKDKNNGGKIGGGETVYWAICQNLRCPHTHEPFPIPDICPICNLPWSSEHCPHTPWDAELKGFLSCPVCGSKEIVDANILPFLNVKNIKKLSNEITQSDKFHDEVLNYHVQQPEEN